MSRSRPKQIAPSDEPYQEIPEAERYYVGRTPARIRLQRQSIYDKDMLMIPMPVAEIQDGDSHYNRWDLDEPETH